MAAFAYSAINAEGLELTGEVHAPDVSSAREQLRVRGLLAEHLEELPASGEDSARTASRRSSRRPCQIFSRQFATMIEAGLNVVSSLVILEEQTDDAYFARDQGAPRGRRGRPPALAGARTPPEDLQPPLRLDGRGRRGAGILDQVLDRVAYQIEKETQIKRRVKGAMMYPTMVLIFATLVLIGLLMFLVPVFVNIFAQLDGELPKLTQIVVAASNQLRAPLVHHLPRLIGVDLGVPRAKSTETGRGSGTGSS
jgi:type IV pilus assembly protein PilC